MQYAEFAFRASIPQEDGSTLADHWAVAIERGADPEVVPQPPPFPELLDFVWQTFLQLSATRSVTGFGVGPITYQDLDAWERVTRTKLSLHDIEIIKQLDNLFFSVRAKHKSKNKGTP